jgi:uncharacterized protein YjiS (DUF1127 family)
MQTRTLKRCAFIPEAAMSDLLARLDTMIEELTKAGSSRCSRSTAAAQAPTGTPNYLETKAVPVVPGVPAEEHNIIRDIGISRTEEQSLQHPSQGKAPLSLSSKRTGTTGTGQEFCGVKRSRHFISNGNNGNYFIDVRSPLGHRAVLDLTPISEAAFNERAAALEFDAGLTRAEAERRTSRALRRRMSCSQRWPLAGRSGCAPFRLRSARSAASNASRRRADLHRAGMGAEGAAVRLEQA